MSRTIMLIPTESGIGLTSISLGLIRAMERKGVRLSLFKPVAQSPGSEEMPDRTTMLTRIRSDLCCAEPLNISDVEALLSGNQKDELMEAIVARYHACAQGADVVLIEGVIPTRKHQFAQSLNDGIAKSLNAEIVFVMAHDKNTATQLHERMELVRSSFGGAKNSSISGVIINKINALQEDKGFNKRDNPVTGDSIPNTMVWNRFLTKLNSSSPIPVLAAIPWCVELMAIRAIDMAHHLKVKVLNAGDMHTRRVRTVLFCAHSISHMLAHLRPGALLVTSADRADVLVTACLAAMNGVEIGAILLTGGDEIDPHVSKLCERAFATGLPLFMINTNTWQTALNLQSFNYEIPVDDHERIEKVQEYVASYINADWIESLTAASKLRRRLSPPAFRYQLTEQARKAGKRVVLPEGNEPRTVKAAAICAARGIATCVLLGNPDEIYRVAAAQGIELGAGIAIIDPKVVRESYVARLVKLRKNKGMNEAVAREQLEDNVVLGTLMLEQNEVDGLVSGAIHTTANTIRPALQLIKTAPGSSLVSSVFFMLLPEQVYVYGDCAINPDPSAEQLAEIAIQSADSAIAFGIEPRVAMLSYSTGTSGVGSDVEKVREATRLAQKKRPDLEIDGPMQYDAAVMTDVAKSKAPNSAVAGRATVFIFPDLNTGNTTYKAVQRSADLISIGPMLQGMRKPVNDLSRGALVDDIVYTIALTAIQASFR
ncbi:TPA: phosphate acetyltransferase [Klebsiella pneumoniae]|uniref:phosphate acetyltransferase n=2 Tax=Klebsiella pneumoniae TaxID=573 RepID=UPI001EE86216|nr:phosphate acetyltransferase [Klebsiella pneumoniae]HDZ2605000.1 phosphate acetyltransferase [Klebsiella pneumoniae]